MNLQSSMESTTAGCRITKSDRVIFNLALVSPGSNRRRSKTGHQITSDAARDRAPSAGRTDYLSRRPQFVRVKNRLSVALMRSAKNCYVESRPATRVS